jgi:hypothetical protein
MRPIRTADQPLTGQAGSLGCSCFDPVSARVLLAHCIRLSRRWSDGLVVGGRPTRASQRLAGPSRPSAVRCIGTTFSPCSGRTGAFLLETSGPGTPPRCCLSRTAASGRPILSRDVSDAETHVGGESSPFTVVVCSRFPFWSGGGSRSKPVRHVPVRPPLIRSAAPDLVFLSLRGLRVEGELHSH